MAVTIVLLGLQQQESFEGFMTGIRANSVKGEVLYLRRGGKFPIEPGLRLEVSDAIKSSPDAYAELLLQPGNVLRVGGDTELGIINDQSDKMKWLLTQGSITLEMLSREVVSTYLNPSEGHELIRVITPDAEVFISEPGIFRINAGSGRTELIVRNGQAVINGQRVKKNRRGMTSKEGVATSDIDPRVEDNFDAWSRERAEALVQTNKALKNTSPWTKKHKEGYETSVDLPHDEETRSNKSMVVSARPGTVSFAEAGVEFCTSQNDWQPVTEQSALEAGDKLRTDAQSYAELGMFPDMYFRLNESSEVLFEKLSNDAVLLKVLRGSAILDVARFDRKELPPITLAGPSTAVVINDAGNYRVDAQSDAITVRGGKVIFNERSVGSCRRIAAGQVSDCDKKHTDNFDRWSEYRGEGEFNSGRGSVAMVTFLEKLRNTRFKNTGFWFQNPGQMYYTFVPFTSVLFRSPYGGSYSTVLSPESLLNRMNPGGRRTMRIPGPQIAPRQP